MTRFFTEETIVYTWKENNQGNDTGFFGSRIVKSDTPQMKLQTIINTIHFNYW